jgi:hypothetical protein
MLFLPFGLFFSSFVHLQNLALLLLHSFSTFPAVVFAISRLWYPEFGQLFFRRQPELMSTGRKKLKKEAGGTMPDRQRGKKGHKLNYYQTGKKKFKRNIVSTADNSLSRTYGLFSASVLGRSGHVFLGGARFSLQECVNLK